jgi:signal transduction histidine kinase
MTPLRRALLGLGAAGVVLAIPVVVIVATSDHTNLKGLIAALALLVAWSFLGTGLYIWDRSPDNLTGPLMVALSFSWLAAGLATSNTPALFVVGTLLNAIPFAILTHLLFAFPTGRLRAKWDRRFVVLGYGITVLGPPIGIVFWDPAVSDDCPECPNNPLLIWANADIYDVLDAIASAIAAVVLGALIWNLVQRFREADDPAERVRDAPVWWAGAATLLFVLALIGTNVGPEEGDFDDYVFAASLLVLATVPYAFWVGTVRWRLWEAEARVAAAGYAERRRVERDLHDGAQQRLVALALELRMVRSKLDSDPGAAADMLDAAAVELGAATQELRELARGLHPPVLSDRGLVAAVEALASRTPLPVTVEADDSERAPESVEAAAYFVVAEALTNVARHAEASCAVVRVARQNGELLVEVEDDGRGGAEPGSGSGLRGLSDRVGALHGTIEVESPVGSGTIVRVRLPAGVRAAGS